MKKEEVLARVMSVGVLPVIRAPSTDLALRAVEAVLEGGISVLEVTLTVPDALTLIQSLSIRFGDSALLGAGSVLSADDAKRCADAGARFIVSPGLNRPMVHAMRDQSIAMIAGSLTPTEVMSAHEAGADLVKVFPCSALGGAKYLSALRGPLPHIKLVPTGGVNAKTAPDFLRAGAVALGVGSDLVDVAELRAGNSQVVIERARELVSVIRRTREEMSQAP